MFSDLYTFERILLREFDNNTLQSFFYFIRFRRGSAYETVTILQLAGWHSIAKEAVMKLGRHLRSACKSLYQHLAFASLPRKKAQIVHILPHISEPFTQGLQYYQGVLYESVGGYSSSLIRALDSSNGRVICTTPVEDDFAEGIALFGGRILQLSWKSGICRIYSLNDLRLLGDMKYFGEGWGLCSDGDSLLRSDGSSHILVCDSQLKVRQEILVRSNKLPVPRLNDLTIAHEKIYSNVLYWNHILEIAPANGAVTAVIDCSNILQVENPESPHAVLNGISYNADYQTYFVSGKNWKNIFEVTWPVSVE